MTTIYKYPIDIAQRQEIVLPHDAEILRAELDPLGMPCVWAKIMKGPNVPPEKRILRIFATGQDITDLAGDHHYLNSFNQGPFVWHVFVQL